MEIALGFCIVLGALGSGGLVFIGAIVALVMAVRRRSGAAPLVGAAPFGAGIRGWLNRGNLLLSGTPARAILLSVSPTGTRTVFCGQRCEIRQGYIDLEVPGVPPYEMQTSLYIPTNLVRDALPGSTMEVRIDPQNQNKVLVVGPDVGYTQGAVRTA